ncbi:hypothetical protein [Micromonospora zhanjiangensis]|uniref:Uncharacterized protein n=1 Tax=Micromonospora zhanjiangensis TaxID=1522057 RepID=A0ABV8KPC0_9ACTN
MSITAAAVLVTAITGLVKCVEEGVVTAVESIVSRLPAVEAVAAA